ncbi:hypothetical protein FS749_006805 [Ceratobasidium sp. UAMH 11750]|nr:hypothetical protein FS749_006805 [Ceratobasidium sp. UAMH 11750]
MMQEGHGIVLDPNEPPFKPTAPVVTLTRLPAYVPVKVAGHTRTITLPNLEPGVIPIVPAAKMFKIKMDVDKNGRVVHSTRSIRRLQFRIRVYRLSISRTDNRVSHSQYNRTAFGKETDTV